MTEPHSHWEEHYSAKPRVWSGRVNARLAEVVAQLSGSRALDLGCGEGADAIWLAEHGWNVVAVDVSTTALARAAEDAGARGVLSRIDFQAHDLERTFPEGAFDLVSAQFFQTPLEMDRTAVLRRAAGAVAPGGTLLIVDHGEAPPWAKFGGHHHHEFPSADDVLAGLALDTAEWKPVHVGPVEREAIGPDGEHAHLIDNVIELRRE
jgi:SAM-dependent methyltransferase